MRRTPVGAVMATSIGGRASRSRSLLCCQPMKLYLMRLAEFPGPDVSPPVPGYLVQTDDGVNVLIDTGVSRQAIGAHRGPGAAFVKMDEEDYVASHPPPTALTPPDAP